LSFLVEVCTLLDEIANIGNVNTNLVDVITYFLYGQSIIKILSCNGIYGEDPFLS
jgi:hypothetical protein